MCTHWFGCRSLGLQRCQRHEHLWYGEGKVLVPAWTLAFAHAKAQLKNMLQSCSLSRGGSRRGLGHW